MAPTTFSRSRLLSTAATSPATMAPVSSPWCDTVAAGVYSKHAPETLERLRCTGGGPVFHRVGRKILYHRDDLDRWISAGRIASTSSGPALDL